MILARIESNTNVRKDVVEFSEHRAFNRYFLIDCIEA